MNHVNRTILPMLAGSLLALAAASLQAGPASQRESACVKAVNQHYGGKARDVRVISSGYSQAGSEVILDADGERWRCQVSGDGQVENIGRQQHRQSKHHGELPASTGTRDLPAGRHAGTLNGPAAQAGEGAWYNHLSGTDRAGAENQLRKNGFHRVGRVDAGKKSDGTVWYNKSTGQCLQVNTVSGQVDSTTDLKTHPGCNGK